MSRPRLVRHLTAAFVQPEEWKDSPEAQAWREELARIERGIDKTVAKMYGLGEPAEGRQRWMDPEPEELARRWISFALGRYLGRWKGAGEAAAAAALRPLDRRLALYVRKFLADRAGGAAAREIEKSVGGLEAFLGGGFSGWHNRLYRGRPIVWVFEAGKRVVAVSHERASAEM